MDCFDYAASAVREALAQGRIGTPAAARLVVHTTADHGQFERQLAQVLDTALTWLDAQVSELSLSGSVAAGQLTAQVRCEAGQSLLVSVGSPGTGRPVVELVVIGNRGVMSWEADETLRLTVPGFEARALSERGEALLKRVKELEGERGQMGEGEIRARRAREVPTVVKTSAAPYGVLLIAGGHTHQESYAAALASDKRCRLIGVTDDKEISPRRKQLNEQLATRLGIPVLADIDTALARPDVQIVSICAEPDRRAPLIMKAAASGKHLYLDKPLATSVAEADAIVAAVQKSGAINQMFSMVRSATAARLKKIVESGALGDIVAVHCDLLFAKGLVGAAKLGKPRAEEATPRSFEVIESKREFHNVGVYPLVLLRWLLGRDVKSVWGTTANYFFEEHQRTNMEDFGQATLELEDGLTATITAGRSGWRSHAMSGLHRTVLVGTKGIASIDLFRPRLEVWADEEPWKLPSRHPEDPMGFWASTQPEMGAAPKRAWVTPPDELSDTGYFLDCIEHGRPSDVTAEDAAKALEVILAVYQSAATGKKVALPLAR